MSATVVHGDCLAVLRDMPDESVHAVVTDPPYGLSNTDPAHVVETLTRWAAGERDYVPTGKGFMGKSWDAFVPPPAVWDECLRVLKPGGHLLAFAGSRTFDLMTLSIRFAGFDIRDGIAWLYGSGFPKSLDVSKAIDQAGGSSPVEQSRVLRVARERAGVSREAVAEAVGCTPSSVRDWEEGRARAVGRPVEHIIPSPRYRTALADLLGYTADERAVVGARTDRRGDGTVVGLGHSGTEYGGPRTDDARTWQGWGTALKPAFEPVVVARKPLAGTVAANVLAHGTGALNIDASKTDAGRWPTNVVLDGHAADALDEQTGEVHSQATNNSPRSMRDGVTPFGHGSAERNHYGAEPGKGASKFFPTFRYQAKAPTRERPSYEREDGTRVAHPTVKPVELCRWLVRLVTPPGGTVLDPFAGSGATVEAALLEGVDVTAIEREGDYLPLIEQRIARVDVKPNADPEPDLMDLLKEAS